MVSLAETPLTGEPDAGNPPVRFGGRGSAITRSLYPYHPALVPTVGLAKMHPRGDALVAFELSTLRNPAFSGHAALERIAHFCWLYKRRFKI